MCENLPELERKKEAKQREREAREKEARKREKAEEKEKRRKEYNAQMEVLAAKEQQKKKSEERKRRKAQAAGEDLVPASSKSLGSFRIKPLFLLQFSAKLVFGMG